MHPVRTLFPVAAAVVLAACTSPAMDTPAELPAEMRAPSAPAAFELTLSRSQLALLQGTTASFEATLTRKPGFTGTVAIGQIGLPGGASLAPVTLGPDQVTATLSVSADALAPHSLPTAVTIQATSPSGGLAVSRPLTVTIYGAPGSLDTSFVGGKAVVPVGRGDDYAYAMAVQPDGKILVAGRSAEHLGDFALIRLDRDGTLDPSFGAGGKVTTDFTGGSDIAYALAVQGDGKIVVAGTSAVNPAARDFGLARYQADGSLDASFGTGGKVTTDFGGDGDTAYALLIQPDGKILLGGETNQGKGVSGGDFALGRYDADGSLDVSFGAAGKVITSPTPGGHGDCVYALALEDVAGQPHILAAGGEGDFALARYTPSGQLDPAFGNGGTLTRIFGSVIGAARAVQITPDGKILLAGHHTHDFALVRFDAAGQLDVGFGEGGKVITPVSASSWDEAQGLAIEADGKIVVAGWAYEKVSATGNFAVARYDVQGRLDASFGGTGMVFTEVAPPTRTDQATAVLLQTDERVPAVRVLVAGYASGANNDFAVTRYWR